MSDKNSNSKKTLVIDHIYDFYELYTLMYSRSAPWKAAESMVAEVTGYKPRHLTYFLADAHVYVNHLEQVRLQTSRNPFGPPQLRLSIPQAATAYERLCLVEPHHIELMGYECHPAIKAEMAV